MCCHFKLKIFTNPFNIIQIPKQEQGSVHVKKAADS